MTTQTKPAGRRGGAWPTGTCPRCGAEVQVFLFHPVTFTHRRGGDASGVICPGSGMYCAELPALAARHG